MKKITQLIVLVLIGTLLTSCLVSGVQGSKNVTKETRMIKSNFNGIKVSMGIEVLLTQGNTADIEVEMDDNIHDLLVTEVEDGILHIYFDEKIGWCKQKTVRITTPEINKLQASSGSSIKGLSIITTSALVIDGSSGSGVQIEVDANRLECNASSGSNITLDGTCKNVYLTSSSGSSITAKNLEAVSAEANASSGANIKLFSTNNIDANASSGGSIYCKGNPKQKSISKSSGGSITIDD